jgi:hypothetical protein
MGGDPCDRALERKDLYLFGRCGFVVFWFVRDYSVVFEWTR